MTKKPKYKETNGIPICPFCKKPTERTGGLGRTTMMYYQPVYDEKGENVNPDMNTTTYNWHCNECGKGYQISGNMTEGFSYV